MKNRIFATSVAMTALSIGLALVLLEPTPGFSAGSEHNRQRGATGKSDFLLSTIAGSSQFTPFLIYNSRKGQYLVVWSDDRNTPARGADIYGQRLNSNGSLIGADFAISTAINDQLFPTIAYNDTDDEYLVVWEDYRDLVTSGADIYAQRISKTGDLLGDNFPIATAPDSQRFPSVTYNGYRNEYLVVWEDERDRFINGSDIYGQRVSSSGRLLESNFPIVTNERDQNSPSVIYNKTDQQYLVVWQDNRNFPSTRTDIYGQRVSTEGDLIGGNFPVSVAPDFQISPFVAYNSTDNEYLVVWEDQRNYDLRGSDIYGQRVSTEGVLIGVNFPISIAARDQFLPSVTYNSADNEYLVVWEDERSSSTSGSDIYGRRVSADGVLLENELAISTAPANQLSPIVAYNDTESEYAVVWFDQRDFATRANDVYGQIVTNGGDLVGSNSCVSPKQDPGPGPTPRDQIRPSVAFNSTDDEYLVVWTHEIRNRTDSRVIYGQRVSSTARPIGDAFQISFAQLAQHAAKVAYNSTDNEYLVVWQQDMPSGRDIYGQRVSSTGTLIGGNFPICTVYADQLVPTLAYNSTDNEYLVAWQDRRDGFSNEDIYGQRVSNLGALLGNEIQITTDTNNQFTPTLAYNSAGNEYLVVWQDNRNIGTTGPDIYARRISSTGTLLETEIEIRLRGIQMFPAVTYGRGANEYLIVWQHDTATTTGGIDIYGCRVSSAGTILDSEIVITNAPGDQRAPSVAYNSADDQYLVAWDDDGNRSRRDPYGLDITGQRISNAGALMDSSFSICHALDQQYIPSITYNSVANQYFVVWEDWRNDFVSGKNIYGQAIE